MPLVRMLTSSAGRNYSWAADEVVSMTDAEAAVWADGVRGVLVDSPVDTPERGRRPIETRAPGKRGPGRPRKHP